MKTPRVFILAAILLLLGACATQISSDVTRFNNLNEPRGQTFIVKAKDAAQEGSLELAAYAGVVTNELTALGYIPAGNQKPDLVVTIDFGVSEPFEDKSYNRPPPYFGPTYFGRPWPYRNRYYSPYYYPYYDPFFDGYGGYYYPSPFERYRYSYLYDTADYNRVVYERSFEMTIQKKDGPYVFEGRAVSVGASTNLPKVMPLIIKSLFEDFPGQNGTTVRVTVKDEK